MTNDTTPAVSGRARLRSALDLIATIAIIVAAGTMIWSSTRTTAPVPRSQPTLQLPKEPLSLEGAPLLGRSDAKVVIIEFSDFQCPYCGKFARDILPALKAKYIDTGQVQLAFRHLALTNIHPRAIAAATASVCAAKQDKFWPAHDELFKEPSALDDDALISHATAAGLDIAGFKACVAKMPADRVAQDGELAKALKVSGTPSFFVGLRGSDGRVSIRQVISGARPVEDFAQAIEKLVGT